MIHAIQGAGLLHSPNGSLIRSRLEFARQRVMARLVRRRTHRCKPGLDVIVSLCMYGLAAMIFAGAAFAAGDAETLSFILLSSGTAITLSALHESGLIL